MKLKKKKPNRLPGKTPRTRPGLAQENETEGQGGVPQEKQEGKQ